MRTPAKQFIFILIWGALAILGEGCTNRFFTPGKEHIPNIEVQNHVPEDVYFKSSDGLNLHGWYFRAKEARGTILVCHGNVENMSTHVTLDLWLIDAGYNIYPGRVRKDHILYCCSHFFNRSHHIHHNF